jgi:hypothetical protein
LNDHQHKTIINLAIVTGIAAVVIAVWAFYNRPMSAPDWQPPFPVTPTRHTKTGRIPLKIFTPATMKFAKILHCCRSKHTAFAPTLLQERKPTFRVLAQEFGMSVVQGIWISNIEKDNEEQIARAIAVINNNRNITMVVVGNESLYRREVDLPRLIDYIEQVRSKVKVPVTTAETWDIWLKYPELAQHVDIVTAHILPFWEKIPAGASVGFVLEKAQALKTVFSQKPLLLGEVGWPSFGRSRGAAEANQVDQAIICALC